MSYRMILPLLGCLSFFGCAERQDRSADQTPDLNQSSQVPPGDLGDNFVSLVSTTSSAKHAVPIGRKIENFSLLDFRGKEHSLADYKKFPILVVAYLGTECPLAKLYGPRLATMAVRYASKGVGFLGIYANSQDSMTEIANFSRRHEIGFPLLKDVGNRVADQMGALRTPEIFVLDKQRIVRYWGRVDDQYGVGYLRPEAEKHDLQIALDELLEGKEVSTPVTPAVGCIIGRIRKPDESATVTYSNQVSRVLQKHCVECHREGEIAPFELAEYDEVSGWAGMIEEVVRQERMPPWFASKEHGHFKNDRRMSNEDKQLIYDWVEAGAPEGDPSELPEPQTWVTGWQLPKEPDFVAPICEEPFTVPAEGVVEYQYFTIDPGFKEDKWVQAMEIQPGNRAVVHHVLMFSASPDNPRRDIGRKFRGGLGGYDGLYVPGYRLKPYPPGTAKRISAGTQLIFQVHYTPVGSEQQDQSRVGMVFADPEEVQYEVRTASAANTALRIPPHAENHRSEAGSPRLPESARLLSFLPHLHLRGKSFFYELVYPGGKRKPLLDIPQYDFNWQLAYVLEEPIEVPAGARVHCVAHFDNSAANPVNPDPTKTVRWGDQTWEEMLIGYFNYVVPVKASDPAEGKDRSLARITELFDHLDRNFDEHLTEEEVPKKFRFMFDQIDANDDDKIDFEEMKALKAFSKAIPSR